MRDGSGAAEGVVSLAEDDYSAPSPDVVHPRAQVAILQRPLPDSSSMSQEMLASESAVPETASFGMQEEVREEAEELEEAQEERRVSLEASFEAEDVGGGGASPRYSQPGTPRLDNSFLDEEDEEQEGARRIDVVDVGDEEGEENDGNDSSPFKRARLELESEDDEEVVQETEDVW